MDAVSTPDFVSGVLYWMYYTLLSLLNLLDTQYILEIEPLKREGIERNLRSNYLRLFNFGFDEFSYFFKTIYG